MKSSTASSHFMRPYLPKLPFETAFLSFFRCAALGKVHWVACIPFGMVEAELAYLALYREMGALATRWAKVVACCALLLAGPRWCLLPAFTTSPVRTSKSLILGVCQCRSTLASVFLSWSWSCVAPKVDFSCWSRCPASSSYLLMRS